MEKRIYKPTYSFEFYFIALLAFSVVGAILIGWYFGANVFIPEVLLIGIVCLLVLLKFPVTFIRDVEFGHDSFRVRWYFFPEKTEDYVSIRDIYKTSIRISETTYRLLHIKNSNEIFSIIDDLISQGKINREQFSREISRQNEAYRRAVLPSGVIAIILWLVFQYFYPNLQVYFGRTGFILFFLPIILSVSWLIKAKEAP